MAIIKKFRIKSFKNTNSIIEFNNISLSYGNRLILDNLNFKIKFTKNDVITNLILFKVMTIFNFENESFYR